MLRLVAVCFLLAGFALSPVAPAAAQGLPAGVDPQNTLVIDTSQGRIVIKLRNDIAPQHAERLKQLARDHFYDNVPFHRDLGRLLLDQMYYQPVIPDKWYDEDWEPW